MTTNFTLTSEAKTLALAEQIGKRLHGGETLELISDLGGGKTTFVRGLSKGFGSSDPVASPTFTISYVYNRPDGKQLHHFDFYRLQEAGVIANELAEVINDEDIVVAVEWGDIVHDVLPKDRVVVEIKAGGETQRTFTFRYPEKFRYLFDKL